MGVSLPSSEADFDVHRRAKAVRSNEPTDRCTFRERLIMMYTILAQAAKNKMTIPLSQWSTEDLVLRAIGFTCVNLFFALSLIAWWKRWPRMTRFLRWRRLTSMSDEEVRPYYITFNVLIVPLMMATLGEVIIEIIKRL